MFGPLLYGDTSCYFCGESVIGMENAFWSDPEKGLFPVHQDCAREHEDG